MRRRAPRLAALLTLACVLAWPSAAPAHKPAIFYGDVGDHGEALKKSGLLLRASCTDGESEPALRVVALNTGPRAYVSASVSEVGDASPRTVWDPEVANGEKVVVLDGSLDGAAGTLSYGDEHGGQVSVTFQADTGEVLGGSHDCMLGGTARKNVGIDYRARPGSHPRTLFDHQGIKLKASCDGTDADPDLHLSVAGPIPVIGASWSQRGNPSALTTYGEHSDPLVGIEDRAEGTMTIALFDTDIALSLAFQSNEGKSLGHPGCLFGATLQTTYPFEVFAGGGSSAPVLDLGPLDLDLACTGAGLGAHLKARSTTADSQLSISHSLGGVADAVTVVDPDADPGDDPLQVDAISNGGGGTAILSTPAGEQTSATYSDADVNNCLAFGSADDVG